MTQLLNGSPSISGALYIITLFSASVPMPVQVPFYSELVGFSVFRSRTFEDGRERFRLHVGYFDSEARAIEGLAVARRYYPGAWITSAPVKDQSSLDDTVRTSFRMIKMAHAQIASTAVVKNSNHLNPTTIPDSQSDSYPQKYVIQLDWTNAPVVARTIPTLPEFGSYNLYAVRALRAGHPQFGLRLGFFNNVRLAMQVAETIRPHYPRLAVLPISLREYGRAIDLVQKRARMILPLSRTA